MITAYIWIDGSGNNFTHDSGGYGIYTEYRAADNSVIETSEVVGGRYSHTTTARMEIMGLLHALLNLKLTCTKVKIYCDNKYVVDTINEGWIDKWESQGWFNYNTGQERANIDLWKQIKDLIRFLSIDLKIKWVRGHDGIAQNELADSLAKKGGQRTSCVIDIEDGSYNAMM